MATGGGGGAGGGGFNFRLARAYVEIDVDLSRFTAGLARVQNRLQSLGARVGAALGGGRSGAGYFSYTAAAIDKLARSAWGAAQAMGSLSAATVGAGVAAVKAVGLVANVVAAGAKLGQQLFQAVQIAVSRTVAEIGKRWTAIVFTALDAFDHIARGFQKAWAILAATPLGRDIGKVWSALVAVAGAAAARVVKFAQWTAQGYALMAQAIWSAVSPVLQKVGTAVTQVAAAVASAAAKAGSALMAVAKWTAQGYAAIAQAIWSAVGPVAQKIGAAFARAWAAVATRLGPVATYITATFQGIAAAGAAVATGFQKAWARVAINANVWAKMGKDILSAIMSAFSGTGLGAAFGKFRSAIGNAFGAAFGALGRAGGAVASAFGSMARTAWSAFDRVAAAVEQTFLKVARGIGKALVTAASGFGRALSGIGSVLGATLLGGGLAAGAVGVVGGLLGRAAARLESRQVAMQRVTGLDPKAAAGLTESIRRMSVDLAGLPMEKLFEIAEMGARLGIEGKNLELFTRDIARVGQVLADIPIDEATTRIARLLAVFHEGPEAAIRLASALNRLDMASTATARDILDITSRLSGPASFLGMKPQQALALATALREAGVPLETGGTAMTQILTRMASRKDVGTFARVSGMGARQFEAVLGTDPLKAIKAFEEGLSRIDRAQGPIAAVRVLDMLHLDGQRVRGTLLQLGRVMDQLNTYEALAAQEWEQTSSIMGGAAKVTQTLAAQWTRLGNTFRMAVQDLAMTLMPLFKGAVEGMRLLLEDIDRAIRGSGDFIRGWAGWGGGLLRTLGLAVQEWRTFLDLARDFIGLQWDRVVAVLGNIGRKIREIVAFEWAHIGEQLGAAINATIDKVGGWLTKLFDYVVDNFARKIATVIGAIPGLFMVPMAAAAALGAAVKAPGAPLGPPAPGPGPKDPWKDFLGDILRIGPGVGAGHAAGIAAGMGKLKDALASRNLFELAGAGMGAIRDRVLRGRMEAETARRFAGEAAPARPLTPAELRAAHRREMMAGARLDWRAHAFRAALAGPPALGPAGGDWLGIAERRRLGLHAPAPGPIRARIERARARARARRGEAAPMNLASAIGAFGDRLKRLGSFISPEMAAKAAAEAKKREENAAFARMIAEEIGKVFGVGGGGGALVGLARLINGAGALK